MTDLEDEGEATELLPGPRPPPGASADRSTAGYTSGAEPTLPSEAAEMGAGPRLGAGQRLAERFVILRPVASGGMGEVYEALDNELGSRVAVKTILPALTSTRGVLRRVRRGVLLARRVAHPNVFLVYELYSVQIGTGESLRFLSMEFLDGESLAQRLRRVGRMSPADALPLVRQMVAALAAAHAQGVVHRDFKPSNVMLVPAEDSSGGDSEALRA